MLGLAHRSQWRDRAGFPPASCCTSLGPADRTSASTACRRGRLSRCPRRGGGGGYSEVTSAVRVSCSSRQAGQPARCARCDRVLDVHGALASEVPCGAAHQPRRAESPGVVHRYKPVGKETAKTTGGRRFTGSGTTDGLPPPGVPLVCSVVSGFLHRGRRHLREVSSGLRQGRRVSCSR